MAGVVRAIEVGSDEQAETRSTRAKIRNALCIRTNYTYRHGEVPIRTTNPTIGA
jgi:hypothetical protein